MVLKVTIFGLAFLVCTLTYAEEWIVEQLTLVPIDRIEVPARATGVVDRVHVREGDNVTPGQLLANLDDQQAKLEAERAATLAIINHQIASESVDLDLAEKNAQRTEQAGVTQAVAQEMAHRKAKNDFRVRAAEKAEAVANNEFQRATLARKAFVDSVSKSEIDSLRLGFERAQLETRQAIFDRDMEALSAASEDASAVEQSLAIEESRLGVKKALADQSIAALRSKSAIHERDLASLTVEHHQLFSPIEGVVVKIHRRPGQWVQMGEPIVEVLRLDRLRAEGFVDLELAKRIRTLPKVVIRSSQSDIANRPGQVVFVMPEVNPVNGEVQFWVEFDNTDHGLYPGMQISIAIQR